ncbi:hypothetical protein BSZ35_14380 [Salinibacter sp. 10B]|uniref:sulfotransferase n=1 Tax=Salinibacter sp. 10B TaxID=1923971 RepID=UPI000CF4CDCF|nr:sulfotransferase [Salinibacter sp. 10B]PQJ35624.1 hypothetical protein BSZ35_14380 [Salinibacter sp. 10B]
MNFEERYGWLDRLLYRIAFRAGTAQHALADVEKGMYGEDLRPVEDPVFITALPRSGTTILLKLLWKTGHFASHTYQDMPFILCPLFWNQFARSFSTEDTTRERAHGDGLQVSETSPEAFEEVVWKHFWSDHYEPDRIRPWTAEDRNPAFNRFFDTHMRKVVAVREEEGQGPLRYVSKNNLNIARLANPAPALQRGTILIPFRAPLQQAASMHRQHHRFLDIHRQDDFVRKYMEAIGHHEFGEGLRPVNFDGWLEDAADPSEFAFWVQYWIAAYRHVLRHAGESTVLLSYARLTDEPAAVLGRLTDCLSIPDDRLVSQADHVRSPREHEVDESDVSNTLLREAEAVYEQLQQRAAALVSS